MKHPIWIALSAALAILAVAFAPPLWHMLAGAPAPQAAERGMPWQVAVDSGGHSTVVGLTLPGSTLASARALWSDDLQVALMAQRGQPAALEAYLENFRAGPLNGRLVLVAEARPEAITAWRERAVREVPVDADARRITLRSDDLAEALQQPLRGITLLPASQLDAATVRARFGEPAERLRSGERIEQWLYPQIGLAIALDSQGREVLQYVAPADFERLLRAPLLAAGATRLP